ncbi:type II toxin-antitoxin system PemK/MazF family toxin [Humibacter sp.]|uniref:type II toxin-antitoxin system PemK/MazF family toxin n=1 Tax=Humibacter sp. TaxID=1940291 RepID=UPI003F810228
MIAKGEIYWVDFGAPSGSALAKRRPALVVQGDHVNRSNLSTVVVAAISSNTALAGHPGNVFLPAATTGLPRDSVVNVTALATVDKDVLSERVASLPPYLQSDVDKGIRLILDL